MNPDLHTVTVTLPASLGEAPAGRFAEDFAARFDEETIFATSMSRAPGMDDMPWSAQWLFSSMPDTELVKAGLDALTTAYEIAAVDFKIEKVPEVNWLEHSYRQLPAFTIGNFYIRGAHITEPPPPGMLDLVIDAATAFGSGDHGTTASCLLLLQQLKTDGLTPATILDMGCGSGVLAIAAARLWPEANILAVDNDPECVIVTERHREINAIGPHLRAVDGDGFHGIQGPYDTIIANILPQPLRDMAADLTGCLDRGGYTILSGMMVNQVDGVMPHYTSRNMTIAGKIDRNEWSAVLLRKN